MYQIKDDGTIYLYDEITQGITARQVIERLNSGVPGGITLRINSSGGDVFEALAVYNLLKAWDNVTVYVDGVCASAASVIAMAGGRVVMPRNAMMMIHAPMSTVTGTSDDMAGMAGLLERITVNLARIYSAKSGQAEERVLDMMKAETWLDGAQAKSLGFCDEVAGEIAARSAKTYEDGVRDERERMKALDAIMSSGREGIIARAKYETFRTADEIAVELLKSERVPERISAPVMSHGMGEHVAEIMSRMRGRL